MATPSLLEYRRGQGIVNPDICGSVWRSHWSKGSHGKGVQIGFLLLIHNRHVEKLVKTCQACQKFSPNIQAPSQPTQLITPSWPLQRWRIDIVGPLTTAQGNYKFAVVAVEYFTKWVEAKPLINIATSGLKRFFWQNIICRFRVPREITVDNAKQFDCHLFKDFHYQMGVKVAFASVYHPILMERWERQTH
jgi:hypothetical protein